VIPFLAIPAAFKALPWLRIAFWIGIVVVIAIEALAIRAFYRKWQAEVEAHAKTRGEYAAFVGAVKARGDEAQREVDRTVKQWKETNEAIKSDAARRIAALERLSRDRPVRPDGSSVPRTTCSPAGADRPAGELVPLADYAALESRCAIDAVRLQGYEDWRQKHNFPVEPE
jgi:hypothetical protein